MTADRRDARMVFADTLTEFKEQRSWYSQKASLFKSRAQYVDLMIIGFGALIAVLPILKPGSALHWTVVATSFLGALVVICQGFQRIFRYGETWPEYRLASERMKREWRLFVNGVAPYDADDAKAQLLYVARLEQIIAEEQKIFFERRRDGADETEGGKPDEQ